MMAWFTSIEMSFDHMLCQKANTKTFTSLIDPDIRNDVKKEQDPSGYKAVPESRNVDVYLFKLKLRGSALIAITLTLISIDKQIK